MDRMYEILSDSAIDSGILSASKMNIYSFHVHTHLYYEMLLYEPFDGSIEINDRKIIIKQPTAVIIAPGDFHSTKLSGKASQVLKLQCNASLIEKEYPTSLLTVGEDECMVKMLFNAAIKYRENKNYLLSVIRMTAAEISFHGEKLTDSISGKSKIVSDTMQYINRNFRRDVNLINAAGEMHVSPQYLSAIFSKTAGITFQNYMIEKRLSFAAALLKDGKHSVTDICYECGYTNLSHFVRSFKKKYNVSPKKFSKTL